jgi:hypothetical protein
VDRKPLVIKMTYTVHASYQEVAYRDDPYSVTSAIESLVRAVRGQLGVDVESVRFHVIEEDA